MVAKSVLATSCEYILELVMVAAPLPSRLTEAVNYKYLPLRVREGAFSN